MKFKYVIAIVLLFSSYSLAQTAFQPEKVVILSLKFESSRLMLEDSLIEYGFSPNRLPKENALVFKIISAGGVVLDEHEIGDPRFVYDIGYIDNVSFSVVLPYNRGADRIEVLDKNQSIAAFDLSDSFDAFCRTPNNICDSDCKEDIDCPMQQEKPPADYSYLPFILLVLLAIGLFYTYRKLREMKILRKLGNR